MAPLGDLAGTTPWNASGVIKRHERPTLELLEDACTGAHRRPTAPTGGPRRPPKAHGALPCTIWLTLCGAVATSASAESRGRSLQPPGSR